MLKPTRKLDVGIDRHESKASITLFNAAVLLSASPRIDRERMDAEGENEAFAVSARCFQDDAAAQVECLRALDVKDVLRAKEVPEVQAVLQGVDAQH